jgi:hypothetical protein
VYRLSSKVQPITGKLQGQDFKRGKPVSSIVGDAQAEFYEVNASAQLVSDFGEPHPESVLFLPPADGTFYSTKLQISQESKFKFRRGEFI